MVTYLELAGLSAVVYNDKDAIVAREYLAADGWTKIGRPKGVRDEFFFDV
jgi:hypothetical protein